MKILIVDDNPVGRNLLCRILERKGAKYLKLRMAWKVLKPPGSMDPT
jgi:CheY-like chemotaxis protein